MKVLQISKSLEPYEYYYTHLSIINPILPKKLTEREVEVIAMFLSLPNEMTGVDMFNTYARKVARERLNNMSIGSLSNHLRSLQDKGFIQKEELTNRLYFSQVIIPNENTQGYQIKLNKII